MATQTKQQQIIDALTSGNNKRAFSIARSFFFGIDTQLKRAIEIAADVEAGKANFYKALGVDTEKETAAAVAGLKVKFNLA